MRLEAIDLTNSSFGMNKNGVRVWELGEKMCKDKGDEIDRLHSHVSVFLTVS
jgi:hypothetical protein